MVGIHEMSVGFKKESLHLLLFRQLLSSRVNSLTRQLAAIKKRQNKQHGYRKQVINMLIVFRRLNRCTKGPRD